MLRRRRSSLSASIARRCCSVRIASLMASLAFSVFALFEHLVDEGVLFRGEADIAGRHDALPIPGEDIGFGNSCQFACSAMGELLLPPAQSPAPMIGSPAKPARRGGTPGFLAAATNRDPGSAP